MISHDIAQQIFVRSVWLRFSDPTMSREAARAAAAEAIAAEWREANSHQDRRLRAASRPLPSQRPAEPDHARTLIDKVLAMCRRLSTQPHPVRRRLREPEAPQAPTEPTARPGIVARVVSALAPEPTPEPPAPRPPLVVAEGSRAQLIDDLPHRYGGDYATENWRRSIEQNILEFPSKRGAKKLDLSSGR
jgi:hypothetical protein